MLSVSSYPANRRLVNSARCISENKVLYNFAHNRENQCIAPAQRVLRSEKNTVIILRMLPFSSYPANSLVNSARCFSGNKIFVLYNFSHNGERNALHFHKGCYGGLMLKKKFRLFSNNNSSVFLKLFSNSPKPILKWFCPNPALKYVLIKKPAHSYIQHP